jgi:hypothetical protein
VSRLFVPHRLRFCLVLAWGFLGIVRGYVSGEDPGLLDSLSACRIKRRDEVPFFSHILGESPEIIADTTRPILLF